ncbi:MAG: hypothetical protein JEZ09_14700 [Salinivirgaceae bacterium]|nr:hypothetical protein [Salinivirgaceae bacterium]
MKVVSSLFVLFVTASVFTSCNSVKLENKRTVKRLNHSMDSLQKEFKKIDVIGYGSLLTEMNQTISQTKELTDSMATLSNEFIQVYGSYSSAAKILSRTINKRLNRIESGLELSKKQIEYLFYDIKHDNIPNDSILIFIEDEKRELLKLKHEVLTFNKSLKAQKEAFDATKAELDQLLKEIN